MYDKRDDPPYDLIAVSYQILMEVIVCRLAFYETRQTISSGI